MPPKSHTSDWQFLRLVREELRLSQRFIASKSGLSQGYLSQLETGDVPNPSIETLSHLAVAFDVPLHYLLRRAGVNCGCDTYKE